MEALQPTPLRAESPRCPAPRALTLSADEVLEQLPALARLTEAAGC